MGQEISQQQQQHHNQNHNQNHSHSHNHNHSHNQNHNHNHNLNQNVKRAQQAHRKSYKDPIYTPASNLSSSSSSNSTDDYDANYRLRHKYNLTKQTYERTKVLGIASTQSDSDSHYAKLNHNNNSSKYLQRSSSQSSDSGIYNSSCHCSSLSSLSAVSSSSASSSSGCPSSLVSSKSSRSLDKQKHYLSHHLYIKSYLDILEEDERARAHFKSARPGGIRNYTPKILGGDSASSTLSASAPASSFGYPSHQTSATKQRSSVNSTTAVVTGRNCKDDPWI
ncbi:myb-like protein A [Drosophila nasuta]|uniref:myb-like protein A n=1 Tax=Drosophila nasuta TaxID=42062 RepID=UPI00295EA53B|nr:myb-like protein A [Drosophila nasuta]XP_060664080.1 myb-like protein A [Drosophila nasuta]